MTISSNKVLKVIIVIVIFKTIFIMMLSFITAILSVQPDHLMNVGQCQVSANPQTKPTNLGRESTYELLSSTPTIAVNYYSARKLIHILPYHGGKKAEGT